MPILLLLFIIVPIIEVFILIQVGQVIGAWWTVGLVVLTAIIGSLLLRMEGLATLFRLQNTLGRGEVPAFELMEGALLLVGGALLLTPGFFTDAIGFTCLLPWTRRPLVRWAMQRGAVFVQARHGEAQGFQHHAETIEARYRPIDDD